MNWTTLLKFRKQVEDLAREGVVLAEWEKSQEVTTREELSHEMETIVADLEQQIQVGIDTVFAEERYRWLDQLGTAMEERTEQIQRLEETLLGLREKLKKAYGFEPKISFGAALGLIGDWAKYQGLIN